jgi:Rieske Fe-S protein
VDEAPALKRPVTRRDFIVWWLAGLLTAFTVALIAPILVYIYPPASSTQKQKKTITLTQSLDTLQEGLGFAFSAPTEFGFVMTDGGGDNYPGKISFNGFVNKVQGQLIVVSATCSHLGCTVTLPTGANHFQCPCHGSQFSLAGEVIHGPAVAPLSHFNWQQTSNPNQIIVEGVVLPGIG